VAADVSDPAQTARASAGASVIYPLRKPPYRPELFPALTRSILNATESSGAKLVFTDNLRVYGPVDGHCVRICLLPPVAARAGPGSRWPPSCSHTEPDDAPVPPGEPGRMVD